VDSLQGQLLVSSPALVDPNFRRTVVLIAHHDEDGAMGLVLTRPSDVKVVDAVPALEGVVEEGAVVSVGGPVQPEAFMVLCDFEDVDEAAARVIGDVGFMPAEAEPEELSIRRMRVFAGYAGWGAGQLEDELEEPSWIVVAAEPEDAFVTDPDALWRTALHRKGGKYTLIASMPFDPSLN
jgi:putative transcriptional regulator